MTGWGDEDIDLGVRLYHEHIPFINCNTAINYHLLHPSNFADNRNSSVANINY